MSFEAVPEEVRDRDCWLCWREAQREGEAIIPKGTLKIIEAIWSRYADGDSITTVEDTKEAGEAFTDGGIDQ